MFAVTGGRAKAGAGRHDERASERAHSEKTAQGEEKTTEESKV